MEALSWRDDCSRLALYAAIPLLAAPHFFSHASVTSLSNRSCLPFIHLL